MNIMTRNPADLAPSGVEMTRLRIAVERAARTVPPFWPLDGAIAVNPLAGFEDLPFAEAVRAGAARFGARSGLSLDLWRRLSAAGRPSAAAVRAAAIAHLGGAEAAFRLLGPNVSLLDCLMARLMTLPAPAEPEQPRDPVAEAVAELCGAFFDAGTASVALPGRERGLFAAAAPVLPHLLPGARRQSQPALSERPLQALAALVAPLVLDGAGLDELLAASIARLPGWAGHLRWRAEHSDPELLRGGPAGIADLIALLLLGDRLAAPRPLIERRAAPAAIRAELGAHFGLAPEKLEGLADLVATLDTADLALIFQQAAEAEYRDTLLAALRPGTPFAVPAAPAKAALVFCIDVRSEPMRRAIEAAGPYQTLGYAGFFGLPIAINRAGEARRRQLPVLVAPQHDLAVLPRAGCEQRADRAERATRRARLADALFGWLKSGSATAFATAEATGPIAGAALIANSIAPQAMAGLRARWQGGDAEAHAPVLEPHGCHTGLDPQARIAYARALFALTGLDPQTKLIVLTGHRGEAVNNPYAAALDCGACAGHGGAPNARAIAAILNDPAVRRALSLPEGGYALAAEHNTTTDAITLFDADLAPPALAEDLAALRHHLAVAGARVRAERAAKLGRASDDLARGAAHWGEVRPEWGLAGNAAFIIAPRSRTADADLAGRAFLHSYDWRDDPEGEALATILTAPMVVAQWINCQYLFSTIDNERYGAGDKTVHNPVARIGVVRGNGGDLAIGLPRQSLFEDDGLPAHVPQRLLTVVEAPLERISAVIAGHPVLQRLFGNEWVQLVAIDPATGTAKRWRADPELNPGGFPRPDEESN